MDSSIGAHELVRYLHFGYPPTLLVVVLVFFLIHSSRVAQDADKQTEVQYGPGGKPLPKRTRMMVAAARDLPAELARDKSKRWFVWLSLCVLTTYIADAAINLAHVMVSNAQQWWCGQAAVVRIFVSF